MDRFHVRRLEGITPKELSEMAIARIKENPDSWDQSSWHCGTTHCYAGHIDLILIERSGIPLSRTEIRDLDLTVYDVQKLMGLDDDVWDALTDPSIRRIETLERLHHSLFPD